MASRDGLEGLTIGAKEELQLATLAAAREILIEQVIAPGLSSELGLARLQAIGDAWCDYLAADVFSGGCFLCAASMEMDGRPGPLRDAVASVMREWMAVLRTNVEAAMRGQELRADLDPGALAFRLNALGMAANWQRQLLDEPAGIEHARSGWRTELDRCKPREGDAAEGREESRDSARSRSRTRSVGPR
jgi:hypothetical protein